jgi:hypothetical protein
LIRPIDRVQVRRNLLPAGGLHPNDNRGTFEGDLSVPYTIGNCVKGIGLGDVFPFEPHAEDLGGSMRAVPGISRVRAACQVNASWHTAIFGRARRRRRAEDAGRRA